MRVRISNTKFLIFAVLYAICTVAINYFLPGILAVVLIFPFFLYLPGHAVLSLVFPFKNSLGKFARTFAGIGMSVGLITLVGMITALSPWGLSPLPVVLIMLAVIVIFSISAIIRDSRIPGDRRLCLECSIPARPNNSLERLLSGILICIILLIAGISIFSIISPPAGERYSEFYMIPSSSGAGKYPSTATTGQSITVTLVVVNHEKQVQSYTIETRLNKNSVDNKPVADLVPGQKMEIPLVVMINDPRSDQEMEFYLYRAGEPAPLIKDPLSLKLTVKTAAAKP